MKFEYCAFINRRTADGRTDFTDLPFDDLERLTLVTEVALKIPYVESARVSKKTQEIDGKPRWGKTVFERTSSSVNGNYTNEDQFRQDLKAALNSDQLFDEIYAAKAECKSLIRL